MGVNPISGEESDRRNEEYHGNKNLWNWNHLGRIGETRLRKMDIESIHAEHSVADYNALEFKLWYFVSSLEEFDELDAWCEKNLQGQFLVAYGIVQFELEEDKILFLLTWGTNEDV